MQIPDDVQKLVCFIEGNGDGNAWLGTGFFVFDRLGVNDAAGKPLPMVYLVTARHCVQQIDPATDPSVDSIRVRLNTTGGGAKEIDTDLDRWIHHDIADVSVYSFGAGAQDLHGFDFLYYPARSHTGPFYLSTGERQNPVDLPAIGPGTEVFMTGLLFYHPGETRIMPIIRTGTVAAYPEDKIALSTGADHAVLIESRSIGGLSGSPVFVHFPPWRYDDDLNLAHLAPPTAPGNAGPNYLLGVVHGAWETKGNDVDGIGDASNEPLNVGISVVVPMARVLELIDGPKLKPEREAAEAALEAPQDTPARPQPRRS